MNRLRVLAMVAPYPHENLNADRLISEPQLRALSKFYGIPEWIGAGTLFGSSRQSIQRAFNSIRQVLDGLVERPVWMDHRRIARASIASRMLPAHLGQPLRRRIQSIESFLNVASGHPSRVALPLAYWRAGMPTPSQPLNPASDGCGLIWYSPYVPIDRSCILMFQQMVDQTCRQYQIEPLITFTTVDEQTFDATVPILFDRASVEDAARAQCCYDALLRNGLELGVVPYRYPQSAMHRLYEISPDYWQSIQMLRDAWDPNRIIAPRRYCP
jgi:4-cresol dehydrogenase (hydroxylating)